MEIVISIMTVIALIITIAADHREKLHKADREHG